jgi:DNA-binding LacI/PurR family transcriptional regulator
MKEVADRAGVAASTVCRALSSNPQIPAATRDRIRRIAEEMGYKPDPLLSAFASRRRGKVQGSEITTIAYATNFSKAQEWKNNPFYRRLFDGARQRANQLGYNLEHFWLREPGMTGRRLSRILYSRGISALCIPPTPQVRGHLSLDWGRFSCVTVGYSLLRPNLHRTTPHHFHGILLAVRELRRLGYRRIGFCIFAGTSKRVDDLWLAGMLLCQQNLPQMRLPFFLFDDRTLRQIPAWCRKEKLEVVIGGEPVILAELQRAGMYGKEVDYATVNWVSDEPDIAGIDQRPDQIAAAAIDLVIAQVQRGERGIPAVPITTMVEGQWVDGKSLRRRL